METEAEALNGEATDSRKMEVQIGGAVTLECDGGCWGHGSGMVPAGGPGKLALDNVVYQEAGEYRCVAPDRKMQDTWRAQLPYYVKVTGEYDKISYQSGSSTLLDVRVSRGSSRIFARGDAFAYINGTRACNAPGERFFVRVREPSDKNYSKRNQTPARCASVSYKLNCDSRDAGNMRDTLCRDWCLTNMTLCGVHCIQPHCRLRLTTLRYLLLNLIITVETACRRSV